MRRVVVVLILLVFDARGNEEPRDSPTWVSSDGRPCAALAVARCGRTGADGRTGDEACPAACRSCGKRKSGCRGVGPTGQPWFAVFPQHSATGTVRALLRKQLGVRTCDHAHAAPEGACPGDVGFVLAANPFRRVVSSAAYHGVVAPCAAEPCRDDARAFRAWVRRHFGDASGTSGTLARASDLLAGLGDVRVVRVNALAADLGAVLGDLGYARLAPARVHCLSSCESGATREHFVPAAAWNGTRVDRSPLYDNRTRRYVTAYFAADFERFGFPRKPARMYD